MNIRLCNKGISPVQRRSIQIFGACLVLIALVETYWIDHAKPNSSLAFVSVFAAIPAILVVISIVAVGRYLAREQDEFIRSLVVRSLLWSFGVIMVVDTFLGVALRSSPGLRILPMLNIDLFCVVTPIGLRIQLWRSR
jgi:hypothetical protein